MEQTSTKTQAQPKEEFFFPGGTEYVPITILASSREEAEKEWQKVRVSTEQPTQNTPKTQSDITSKKNN